MVDSNKIEELLSSIPPLPKTLQMVIKALNSDDLTKAAKITQEDHALTFYLKKLVNKPYFGFGSQVENITQIYGALGVLRAKQVINSYMISLILPRSWVLFDLSKEGFEDLQISTIEAWEAILIKLEIKDWEISLSSTMLPASIIVCERLFGEYENELRILKEQRFITADKILKNRTGEGFFDIAIKIAKLWMMPQKSIDILESSSIKESRERHKKEIVQISKYLHLLFFHITSKPKFIRAKLNDIIDLDIEFIEDVEDRFYEIAKELD